MTAKSQREARDKDCQGVADLVALPAQALEPPADEEHARELLEEAGLRSQMPRDHVCSAEAALRLGDRERATDPYPRAENMRVEFAALAHSRAARRVDAGRAREPL